MKDNVSNASKFITIYNELDKWLRKEFQVGYNIAHTDLIRKMANKNKIFYIYKDDLIAFAELRNIIEHNPYKRYAEPIFEPHDYIIGKYEEIMNKIINPPNAFTTIAIRTENIYTTTLDSFAIDVMKEMNKNIFTHVPVIENGILVGVFSENTIFTYMAENEDVLIEKDVKVREFFEFLSIENHKSESFKFISRNKTVIDVEGMFREYLYDKKRLAVIFITETGGKDEKILGMITAWDIAGNKL